MRWCTAARESPGHGSLGMTRSKFQNIREQHSCAKNTGSKTLPEKVEGRQTSSRKTESATPIDVHERPTQERAQQIVRAHEEQLAERLRELQEELPRSDRDMSSIRITI